MTAKDIFAGVRALVDDMEQGYATDDVLVPLLQLAQESLIAAVFNNPNIGKMKSVVILTNVTAGTKSLKGYFGTGKELELLDSIKSIKERPTGQDELSWSRMDPVDEVPTQNPNTYNGVYLFTGDSLELPGSSQAMDFRIFGSFDPKPITSPESPIIPGTSVILKFAVASLVSGPHGNQQLADNYAKQAIAEKNTYFNTAIMEIQEEPVRQRPHGGGQYDTNYEYW